LTLTIAAATTAYAQQPPNVQMLYSNCQAAQGTKESVACGQYIAGVGDQLILNSALRSATGPVAWKKISKLAICGTPDHLAMRQAFLNWAPKHQQDWTKPRTVGVVKALRESWPCPAP